MNQSAIFVLDVPLMKPFLSTIPNGIPHKDNYKEINNGFLEAVYLINMLLCTTLEHLLWIIMYRTLWAVDIYIYTTYRQNRPIRYLLLYWITETTSNA